jgi:two-component sensor histidine kinase
MDHRVKNLFSLAIGVLSLSGRSAKTAHGVVETASARLTALARAHALTLSHN